MKAGSVQAKASSDAHRQSPGLMKPQTVTTGHHHKRDDYPFFFDDFGFTSAEHGV